MKIPKLFSVRDSCVLEMPFLGIYVCSPKMVDLAKIESKGSMIQRPADTFRPLVLTYICISCSVWTVNVSGLLSFYVAQVFVYFVRL